MVVPTRSSSTPRAAECDTPAAEAAGPTREAALVQILREGECTASELAARIGVSVQAMRRHLRSLEEAGLVTASPATEGPGRPSNRWRLTDSGHDRFTDGSEHFALGLLQSMASTLPPDTIAGLLHGQAREKAADYRRRIGSGSLSERLERLVELRRREGYVAECRPENREHKELPRSVSEAPSWLIREFHCSVMRIAEEFPVVCDQELQLLRHTFPDCQVERVHWRLEEGHSCGFRLTPRSSGAPTSDPATPPATV